MPTEVWRVLCAVFVVWCLAVLVKAASALRRNEPYVFSMWDGGAMRVGKRLSRTGIHMKVASAILMASCLLGIVTGAVAHRVLFPCLVVVVAIGMVCDFVLVEKE